jgi:hypothetical protein
MSSPEKNQIAVVAKQAELEKQDNPLNAAAAPQIFVTARNEAQEAWSDARVTAADLRRPDPMGVHVGSRVLEETVFASLQASATTFMDAELGANTMVPRTDRRFADIEAMAQAFIAERMSEFHGGGRVLEFPLSKRNAA